MSKRYLGGDIYFEQKENSQEFSEDEGGGGSSTLSGLADVDISNPTDGQTLVYNATSGKWENGDGGGGDIFETLGTISAANVPMTYDEEHQRWAGTVDTNITVENASICAVRNMALKINGQPYSVAPIRADSAASTGETDATVVFFEAMMGQLARIVITNYETVAPVITDLSAEVYTPSSELALFFSPEK